MIKLDEGKNKILIKNISFDKDKNFNSVDLIDFNYIDKDDQRNLFKIFKNDKFYILKGDYLNAEKLIKNILLEDKNKLDLNSDLKVEINIDKVRLDEEFVLNDLSGNLNFKNQKLFDGYLNGNFSNNKNEFHNQNYQ